MNPICEDAMKHGVMLMRQTFTTARGVYTLDIRRWNGDIYLYKFKGKMLVEAQNLSKMPGRE